MLNRFVDVIYHPRAAWDEIVGLRAKNEVLSEVFLKFYKVGMPLDHDAAINWIERLIAKCERCYLVERENAQLLRLLDEHHISVLFL